MTKNGTANSLILPAVTLSAMPAGRVWCYLPGEPGRGAFVDAEELAGAVLRMIDKGDLR